MFMKHDEDSVDDIDLRRQILLADISELLEYVKVNINFINNLLPGEYDEIY